MKKKEIEDKINKNNNCNKKKFELETKITDMKNKMTTITYNHIPQYEKFLCRLEREYNNLPNDPQDFVRNNYKNELTDYCNDIQTLKTENNLLTDRLNYLKNIP